jgi:hypothetical protein
MTLMYDIIVENSDESYNLKFLHQILITRNMTYYLIVSKFLNEFWKHY